MKQSRLSGLDLTKALALYLVVLYHLTFRNEPDLYAGRALDYIEYGLSTLMSCCVPLLFAVSGALALNRPVDLKRNFRRAVQVLILAVVWAFLALAAVLALRGEKLSVGEFLTIAYELKVGYIQHLWYLPTFFFLTLMTPLMQTLKAANQKVYRYGLMILFVYASVNLLLSDLEYLARWVLGRLGHTGDREFFWYTDFFAYHYWYAFLYYALGAFLVERREQLVKYRKWAVLAIPVCGVCLTVFAFARSFVRESVFDPVFNNYGSIFTMVLTASVLSLCLGAKPGEKAGGLLQSLSSQSFGVYLIHWLLIEVLLVHFPGVTGSNRLAPATAILVLGASWGLSWAAAKIPLVKNLFTVSPKWVRGE